MPLAPDERIAEIALRVVQEDQGITLEDLRNRVDEALAGDTAAPAPEDGPAKTPDAQPESGSGDQPATGAASQTSRDRSAGEPAETAIAPLVNGAVMDTINILIVQARLYVDLRAERLSTPKYTHAYTDESTAEAYSLLATRSHWQAGITPFSLNVAHGEEVLWGGEPWTIAGMSDDQITLLAGEQLRPLSLKAFYTLLDRRLIVPQGNAGTAGTVESSPKLTEEGRLLLRRASSEHKATASRRFKAIAHKLLGGEPADDAPRLPSATLYRLIRAYKTAEARYGSGYIGLLPGYSQCGHRTQRITGERLELVQQYAKEYEVPDRPTKRSVYRKLKAACEGKGLEVPSYHFFCYYLNMRPRFEQELRRRGRRGAYKLEPHYWHLEYDTPRHGSRPFEVAYLDHTVADVVLVSSSGKVIIVGRVVVSFLVDGYSRRILAAYCSIDSSSSSYRSDLMIMRECVRRWHRLPQIIVVDRGADFGSVYFESLLARYECVKKERPAAKPRAGTIVERIFGTGNTEFFHLLRGNTQNLRNNRELTPEIDPEGRAIWSIGPLYVALCWWAYEVYDQQYHETLLASPRDTFNAAIASSGNRTHKFIAYDQDLIFDTLPTTRKGTAKVTLEGIKVNYVYYWHEDMRRAEVLETSVPVKYDPFDAGIAYAYILGRWVQCYSRYHAEYRGRSEREIKEATRILREKYSARGECLDISDRKMAEYLVSLEAAEDLQEQRLRDREQQVIFSIIKQMSAGGDSGVGGTFDFQSALTASIKATGGSEDVLSLPVHTLSSNGLGNGHESSFGFLAASSGTGTASAAGDDGGMGGDLYDADDADDADSADGSYWDRLTDYGEL
jgi:transposase InsO family protein